MRIVSRRGLTGRMIVNTLLWIIFILVGISAVWFLVKRLIG